MTDDPEWCSCQITQKKYECQYINVYRNESKFRTRRSNCGLQKGVVR